MCNCQAFFDRFDDFLRRRTRPFRMTQQKKAARKGGFGFA
jgi:hypothetical protein